MNLNCILHVRDCWAISDPNGILTIKASKDITIEAKSTEKVFAGISLSTPKGYILEVIELGYTVEEKYVTNTENMYIHIINKHIKNTIDIKRGYNIAKLIMKSYEPIQLVMSV